LAQFTRSAASGRRFRRGTKPFRKYPTVFERITCASVAGGRAAAREFEIITK
jgi:hypothetical protein